MQAPILIKPLIFYGDGKQDPTDWMKEFMKAARANRWDTDEDKRNYMEVFLKDDAEDW